MSRPVLSVAMKEASGINFEPLDVHPETTKSAPYVVPGDMIELREVPMPLSAKQKTKRALGEDVGQTTITRTGLFEQIGYPKIAPGEQLTTREIEKRRNEGLHGVGKAGDRFLVVAVCFFEPDGKWYYMLNNGKPHGMGWTRCSFRFTKV